MRDFLALSWTWWCTELHSPLSDCKRSWLCPSVSVTKAPNVPRRKWRHSGGIFCLSRNNAMHCSKRLGIGDFFQEWGFSFGHFFMGFDGLCHFSAHEGGRARGSHENCSQGTTGRTSACDETGLWHWDGVLWRGIAPTKARKWEGKAKSISRICTFFSSRLLSQRQILNLFIFFFQLEQDLQALHEEISLLKESRTEANRNMLANMTEISQLYVHVH